MPTDESVGMRHAPLRGWGVRPFLRQQGGVGGELLSSVVHIPVPSVLFVAKFGILGASFIQPFRREPSYRFPPRLV